MSIQILTYHNKRCFHHSQINFITKRYSNLLNSNSITIKLFHQYKYIIKHQVFRSKVQNFRLQPIVTILKVPLTNVLLTTAIFLNKITHVTKSSNQTLYLKLKVKNFMDRVLTINQGKLNWLQKIWWWVHQHADNIKKFKFYSKKQMWPTCHDKKVNLNKDGLD